MMYQLHNLHIGCILGNIFNNRDSLCLYCHLIHFVIYFNQIIIQRYFSKKHFAFLIRQSRLIDNLLLFGQQIDLTSEDSSTSIRFHNDRIVGHRHFIIASFHRSDI